LIFINGHGSQIAHVAFVGTHYIPKQHHKKDEENQQRNQRENSNA
jgi:hypothetical protein